MFEQFYDGKRVLVTGHTGFKGSWLSLWLKKMGAKVGGFGLEAPTSPDFHSLIAKYAFDKQWRGDIRDYAQVRNTLHEFRPELIFHLAAQSLVRPSYEQPVETFMTNTVGTLHVLEAARQLRLPASIVLITTDKCYENREWSFSYRENDSLGGLDPYSASKAAAEIIIHSWRESFFSPSRELGRVASARGGNVIGGGDYAQDRIIPDAIRAILAGEELIVRNPEATRPWQHVLDCLSGYLELGKKLTESRSKTEIASAFNFGPGPQGSVPVRTVVERVFAAIPGKWKSPPQEQQPHEATKLNLAIDKATALLGWYPKLSFSEGIKMTVEWYDQRHFNLNNDMLTFSLSQIDRFERTVEPCN